MLRFSHLQSHSDFGKHLLFALLAPRNVVDPGGSKQRLFVVFSAPSHHLKAVPAGSQAGKALGSGWALVGRAGQGRKEHCADVTWSVTN